MSIWTLPIILVSGTLLTGIAILLQHTAQIEWYRYQLSKSRFLARSGLEITDWPAIPTQPIVTTTNVWAIKSVARRINAPVDGEIWIVHTSTQRLSIGITTGAVTVLFQPPTGDRQIQEFL